MEAVRTYPDIEAYHAEDERRRRSPEADYGCWPARVAWVETTGEVYVFPARGGGLEVLARGLGEEAVEAGLEAPEGFSGYLARAGDHRAWVARDGRIERELEATYEARLSSPTGFAWGYGGSGPYALAHSVLSDHLGRGAPKGLAEQFKLAVVARQDFHGPLLLARQDVEAFLARVGIT